MNYNETRYTELIQDSDFVLLRTNLCAKYLPNQGNILELGVWHGKNTRIYQKHSRADFYGIDLSLENMKQSISILKEAKACDLNTEKIPWDESTFDCVLCTEVIEHIFNTDFLVEEIHRVLKKDGTLILTTPNLASLSNRILLFFTGWQPFGTEISSRHSNYGNPLRKRLVPAGHIRDFTYSALVELIEANGFTITKKTSIPLIQKQPFAFIEGLACKFFPSLGGNSIVICKKETSK
jgi:SAM-dependent methyltransferase